jgi:GPH family glycoside/pentoside/hexuronide:cation symporter/probable glucitol transport protein GutA
LRYPLDFAIIVTPSAAFRNHREDALPNYTSRGERLAFGIGLLGQNIVYGISVGFMMFAFTDIAGIAPATVGLIFLIARGWDALNDPVMGYIADHTRTRWGRFRPWLLWTPVPIGILTILPFAGGVAGPHAVAWAALLYLLWGIAYTLNDIPFWALTSAMSPDSAERTRIITLGRACAMVGLGIPTVTLPALAQRFATAGTSAVPGTVTGLDGGGSSSGAGYLPAVVLLVVIAVPLMLVAFLHTRERVPAASRGPAPRELFGMLRRNHPLQIIVASGLLNSFSFVAQAMTVYFVTHNLADPGLMVWFGGTGILALAGGVLVTPILTLRWSKRAVMVATSLARAPVGVALFWSGYTNLSVAVGMYALLVGLMGPAVVLQTAMLADSIDWGAARTGVRAEGTVFSFQTLLSKANGALGGAAAGYLLARVGYEAGTAQSIETLQGIFTILTLAPAAAGILSAIPWFWYDLDR